MNDLLVNIILYVKDQIASTSFYEKVLGLKPVLNVPGMTEFELSNRTKLGLMPEEGIYHLLKDKIPNPNKASGIPRAELYLSVENPIEMHQRAISEGGKELSAYEMRSWGDEAAYSMDLDGHIIVFAKLRK